MFFSVDRIIGKRAVLMGEDNKPLEVGMDLLPPGAKSGDMLYYANGRFTSAPAKTQERRERMADVLGQLLHRGGEDEPD